MEWLGCMDMLSGGNFADGSCCHSLAKFMAFCRCGRGTDFLVSVVSCPEWQLPPVLRAVVSLIHLQLGITLLLMPVQIVIFHGISLTSFIANLLQFPGDIYHGSVDSRRDGCAFKRAVYSGTRVMVSCRPVFGFTFLGVKEFAGRVDQHC